MEGPQHIPRNITETLYWNWNIWRKLHKTSTWTPRRTGGIQYKVEKIVKHQRRGKGYQYFIKWKGYPIEEATWEPEANISKDGDMLTRYKLQHQLWRTWWSRQLSRRQSCGLSSNHHKRSKLIIWYPLSPPSNCHKSLFMIHKDNTLKTWRKTIKKLTHSIDSTNKTSIEHRYQNYSPTSFIKQNDYWYFLHSIIFLWFQH